MCVCGVCCVGINSLALVAVLSIAPPRARGPVGVQGAGGGEAGGGGFPVGDASHPSKNGDGHSGEVCGLRNHGDENWVHGVYNRLVCSNAPMLH